MLKFTCGCSSKIEVPIPDVGVKAKYISTFDSLAFDAEGFIICAIHRQRRLGWRTVPYAINHRPKGLPADMTELEWEQWVLYRTEPMRVRDESEIHSEISFTGSVDLRDRTDASDLGNAILGNVAKQGVTPTVAHDWQRRRVAS